MDIDEVARRRRATQRLDGPSHEHAEDTVAALLAVQSQDHHPAACSVAMRTAGLTVDGFARAFDTGRILRTHVLRPTWHFVQPADLRWLLALTAPRVHVTNGSMYRQLGLDTTLLDRATATIVAALDGNHLTRAELGTALAAAGIEAAGQRLAYIAMHAELEQVVCSGPMRARQHTYALLDERVPAAPHRDREAALRELVVRFVAGHGPATSRDLQLWSSLTVADVTAGLELAGDALKSVVVDGRTFHFVPGPAPPVPPSPTVHLLQGYDEYLSGALDSRDVHDRAGRLPVGGRPVHNAHVLRDGQLAGHWRRTLRRRTVDVEVALYVPFDAAQLDALQAAADRYASFAGVDAAAVSVTTTTARA